MTRSGTPSEGFASSDGLASPELGTSGGAAVHRLPVPWQVADSRTVTALAVAQDSERVRVALVGEIDLDSATHVHRAVLNALRRYGPTELELDMSEVEFLDAAGVRTLLACRADAARVGCRLTTLHVLPTVRRVLEITGTLDVLGVREPAADVPPVPYR